VSERLLNDALAEALRPLVAELVAVEVERVLAERELYEPPPWQTVAEYAHDHRTTAAAVRARIRRGSLPAIRPPGGREYLIQADRSQDGAS
jgi:hypothetical protein